MCLFIQRSAILCEDVSFYIKRRILHLVALIWRPMLPADCSRSCSWDSAWVGARTTMSSISSAFVMVCARYHFLFSFFRDNFFHRISTSKIRLSLLRNMTQTNKTIHYDCSSLNNWDVSNKYTITQTNSMLFRRYPKQLIRMKNMITSSNSAWK